MLDGQYEQASIVGCLAEHLQANVVVSYVPDLVSRQPWHASFRARPTIAFVRKQRLLGPLADNATGE